MTSLAHRQEQDVDIVQLPPRLVMANADAARRQLRQLIEAGSGRLVLDLGQAEMIDSTGLGVIVGSLKAARGRQGDIYLAAMNANLRALFELTRLHSVFEIFDNTDLAVRAFQTRATGTNG